MKTKKILVEMPVDWEEQLSTMNHAWIGKTLYEILERSPVVEPCEDAISRQAAINVADYTDYIGLAVEDAKKVTDAVVKELKCLPPATPKQRTMRWIKKDVLDFKCSACGEKAIIANWTPILSDFCPVCGAKKESEE